MKFYSVLFAFCISLVLFSCKPPKQTVTANTRNLVDLSVKRTYASKSKPAKAEQTKDESEKTEQKAATTAPKTNKTRFTVSFYSIGAGIEDEKVDRLKSYLSKYGREKKELNYQIVPWGKEGEVDICFPLTELTPTEQKQFIADVKKELGTTKWVHFFENKPCRENQ